ncbi:hypothetical protein [Brevundimonas sp.]|uniref:hypothetical protein n=1 Tax=Brevundimonas sp. TaxID=1871086 RepID=UPI003AF558BF
MSDAAQKAEAEKALKLKSEAEPPHHPEAGQTADEGMQPINERQGAPSGALDAEGHRPVLERSRKVR